MTVDGGDIRGLLGLILPDIDERMAVTAKPGEQISKV